MAFEWYIERTTIDAQKVLNSVETFDDIVQVYEELLFHVFHVSESNIFLENLLLTTRNGRRPHTIIKVSRRGQHRPLRFDDSLSIRAIRNTTRKRYLCVSYGITSSVASRLHQMRRKYIKTYCLLFHPLYSHLLPSCSSDIRSIFTLDEDDKIWPSLDATCIPSSTSSMTTDPEMPDLLPPPPTPMPSANDAPDNAIEEAAPPATAAPAGAAAAVVPLQMAPMDDYLDDLCDCAELMSFAIGYFTLVNRRENLYADLESNRIAGSVIRGLDHLLREPIRYELAIDEFQRALRCLEESVEPGSELAERLHLSNLSAQLSLLENDIEVDVETLRAREYRTPRATDEG